MHIGEPSKVQLGSLELYNGENIYRIHVQRLAALNI